MIDQFAEMRARFAGLVFDSAPALFAELHEHYQRPGRHYHTLEHVAACLSQVDWWEQSVERTVPRTVRFAVWYHDLIYDPQRDDNERRCAERAREVAFQLEWPECDAQEVYELVMATAHRSDAQPAPTDRDGDPWRALIGDADLAILGAPRERYRRYAEDIRAEYAHVPDDRYAAGRSALLRGFKTADRIYRLDLFEATYGRAARANIDTEIALLNGGASGV